MIQIAVLDDYQGIALAIADWGSLGRDVRTCALAEPLADAQDAAARLREFDILVAMRERTPFPRALLEQLPRLRLLVTTGMRNAAIDVKAAAEQGVLVCGTEMLSYPTAEL